MTGSEYDKRTTEELAGDYERLQEERREATRRAEWLGREAVLVEALLMSRLGDGEAVVSPHSGRVCFKAEGSLGAARVNKDAVDEYAALLPDELQPRSETRYPSVTAIRQAIKDRRITRDRGAELLIEGQPGSVLRWRTIDGVAA